jgi:hypothetical protein
MEGRAERCASRIGKECAICHLLTKLLGPDQV